MLAIQLDSRALFVARWRDLLLALIDEDAMHDAPLRREFRELVSEGAAEASARCRRLSPRAHLSQQHAECHVAQPRHRVVRREGHGAPARRSSKRPGWRLVNERPTAVRRRAAVIGAPSC